MIGNNITSESKTVVKDAMDPDCFAGIYKDIAMYISVETAINMFHLFQGQQVTFPMRLYDASIIANIIVKEYEEGADIKELSKKYSYSERRIRQIVKEHW
ncbi:MAG: Mor transcription activator family protein [Lachnospiraceae bacterium]|nr:Mor transcription activator family protein [Lachnospiraceae bacterium]